MPEELKIAIIDDDRMSSHNWNILLNFIGETPVMMTGGNWQQMMDMESDSNIVAVMIGNLMESTFNENAVAELIQAIHSWHHEIPILLNGHDKELENLPEASKDLIIEIPKASANYQVILKSFKKARQLRGFASTELKSSLISETGTAMFRSLVGDSEVMQELRKLINQVADKNVNVLVLGESGTGKEIVARNLHYHSGRGDEAFVVVNCAAISEELLFGMELGFNGAKESRMGYFEKAAGGTLFLDKINDMPLEIQAKVMAALENQCFEKVGGTESIPISARIVAATHRNLEEKISTGQFREDLFYRLSVVPVQVPALKEHIEDIPDLVVELIARLEHQDDNSIRFNSSAMLSLQRHAWAGNVRELTNLVERLSIVRTNDVIAVNDLPVEYRHVRADEIARMEGTDGGLEEAEGGSGNGEDSSALSPGSGVQVLQPLTETNLEQYLENFEKHLIRVALDDSTGMLSFAAQRLELSEESLQEKMQHFSLSA